MVSFKFPPLQRSKEHSRSLSTLNLKRYVISQQGIQGMQFFDMRGHPHDQILATIVVTAVNADEEGDGDGDVGDGEDINSILRPTVPIEDMEFTPGYKEDESIKAAEFTDVSRKSGC